MASAADEAGHLSGRHESNNAVEGLDREGGTPLLFRGEGAQADPRRADAADAYRENVTLRDLARHMGYSYNYAPHLFHQYFCMGFCEMINMHRLDEAARLLKKPSFNITEIAGQTSFSTIRTFNSAFKKRFLMTPSEYALSVSASGIV